jgi:hypothetical protein
MCVDTKNQFRSIYARNSRQAVVIGRPFSPYSAIGRLLGKTRLRRQTWDSAPEFGAWIGHLRGGN